MNRDIIDINDFTILVETGSSNQPMVDACVFDEPVIAVAFYGSGNVDLAVKYGDKQRQFSRTKGLTLAFYANQEVEFEHTVSANKPLECIVIATTASNLDKLPNQEGELFGEMLEQLVNPKDHYVEGPSFLMPPEMQTIVDQIFNIKYQGKARMMFFRSQITALLSHFFGQLANSNSGTIRPKDSHRLNRAKEILLQNLDSPPSLTELAQEIGLNTTKLKKEFKEVFGLPVFKYLQNQRLTTAHALISQNQATVQEAAWQVGYDSLSSFSNAFAKKFGYRPSQIK